MKPEMFVCVCVWGRGVNAYIFSSLLGGSH